MVERHHQKAGWANADVTAEECMAMRLLYSSGDYTFDELGMMFGINSDTASSHVRDNCVVHAIDGGDNDD